MEKFDPMIVKILSENLKHRHQYCAKKFRVVRKGVVHLEVEDLETKSLMSSSSSRHLGKSLLSSLLSS